MGIEEIMDLPLKYWLTLKEACAMKGLNYKTALNRPEFRPNKGVAEGIVGGRQVFRRETVMEWINKTDNEIEQMLKEQGEDQGPVAS